MRNDYCTCGMVPLRYYEQIQTVDGTVHNKLGPCYVKTCRTKSLSDLMDKFSRKTEESGPGLKKLDPYDGWIHELDLLPDA